MPRVFVWKNGGSMAKEISFQMPLSESKPIPDGPPRPRSDKKVYKLTEAWGAMSAEESAPLVMAALANPNSGVTRKRLEAFIFEQLFYFTHLPEASEWGGIFADHLVKYDPKFFPATLIFGELRRMADQQAKGYSVQKTARYAEIKIRALVRLLVEGLPASLETVFIEPGQEQTAR